MNYYEYQMLQEEEERRKNSPLRKKFLGYAENKIKDKSKELLSKALKDKLGENAASTAATNAVKDAVATELASGVGAGTTAGTAAGSAATGAGIGAGSAAGTAAGTTAATTGATAAGAGAGAAGAAGTGAAAGGATAGGAAASGAAAGGSTAGGAAAAGPIGALVALGAMALTGTNRKRAKKSNQFLQNIAENNLKNLEKSNLQQVNNSAQIIGQGVDNQVTTGDLYIPTNNGTMTGGASNVFNGNAQPNPLEDPISLYQDSLRQQGFNDDVVNGVRQGLNSGNKEIDQWIKQYNNGAGRENPINIPQTEEEIALARQGQFNLPAKEGKADVEGTLFDKFINGIGDLASGYQENSTTKFSPKNLQRDKNKGVMNRIGEFAGTMSRVAKNPLVYGTLAGGIAATMGNPFALGIGAKYAQEKAMSDVYRNVLAKNGINIPETVFGNLTSKDMDAIMLPELKKIYYQSMADWRDKKLEDDKEYKTRKLEIDQQNANSKAIQAGAAKTKADKYNSGGSKGSTTKPKAEIKTAKPSGQYVIGKTPSGKQVKVPIERVKEFKSNGGKIVG